MVLVNLEELGIADETYLFCTTDHGTPGSGNRPLALGKGTVWEGGLKVPLFFRGPGIVPGSVSHVRATGMDLVPTVADLAGLSDKLPRGVEGGSLAPVLTTNGRGSVVRPRKEIVFHFPHYDFDPLGPASAILWGDYKLIRFYEDPSSPKLFNVRTDPYERNNLLSALPAKAEALEKRLDAYLSEVDARLPRVNGNFDPGEEAWRPRGGDRPRRDNRGLSARRRDREGRAQANRRNGRVCGGPIRRPESSSDVIWPFAASCRRALALAPLYDDPRQLPCAPTCGRSDSRRTSAGG